LDVVTDNALRKRKYEKDELEGAQPLMVTTSSDGGVKVFSGDSLLFSVAQDGIILITNDIGVAGTAGFGVGVCPTLPAGFT